MVQAVQATISPWLPQGLPQGPKDRGTEGAAASVVTAAAKDHRFQGLRRGEEFPLEAWHFAPGAVGSGGWSGWWTWWSCERLANFVVSSCYFSWIHLWSMFFEAWHWNFWKTTPLLLDRWCGGLSARASTDAWVFVGESNRHISSDIQPEFHSWHDHWHFSMKDNLPIKMKLPSNGIRSRKAGQRDRRTGLSMVCISESLAWIQYLSKHQFAESTIAKAR